MLKFYKVDLWYQDENIYEFQMDYSSIPLKAMLFICNELHTNNYNFPTIILPHVLAEEPKC